MDQLTNESLTGFASLLSPTSLQPLVDTNVSGVSTANHTTYGINVLHHATATAVTLHNLDPFHGHHVSELSSANDGSNMQIGCQPNQHVGGHKMIKSQSVFVSFHTF